MRRALPLSVQLVLTFVGLLIGITAVLTTAAYTSLRSNLETEASRNVGLVTRTREQTLTQLFQLRQKRAEGFLASIESLCAEPLDSGRLAWVDDCVATMIEDFRWSERAVGVLLTHRNRRRGRSGAAVAVGELPPGALAKVIRNADGTVEYMMKATAGLTTLGLQFDHADVAALFEDHWGLGRSASVFLVDSEGQFLTPAGSELASVPADRKADFLNLCQSGADAFVDLDYRGVKTFQSFRPLGVLGTACVAASVDYQEALAPAERLRTELVTRGAWFVLVGIALSLVAAQWISAPVRRLAASARKLQTGRFDRPIPLAGPSEVRELGRAFNAMGNDLAELVAKEQAARRLAEDANRSKDEFLATVSHELRTPLTAILGWSQMLRSERLPADRVRHGVSVIERSARAQAQLIDDLLDVSRIVSNRLRIAREPVRLVDVIEGALDTVLPQAVAKEVKIETSFPDSALVLGDPRRLEQVVWNLTWNAIKFTPPSGRVKVELKRTNRQLVLTVADTGVGISSSFLPHVFEWFRQEDARSRSQSGLGLGLGIVRHLVQLHGGSVHAESRGLGHGATFTVTLPVYEPAAPVQSLPRHVPTPPAPIARSLDATRVLLVEDDEATRELVRTTLESAGASVEAVATAKDARREMLSDAPDVLISDIRMPEEDGYSLLRSLRGAGVVTPAIALTAYARREDAEDARAAGFQVHVPKPVDAGRLIDAVATVLRNNTIH
jgi:signal transduction histidine kinase